VEPLRRLEEWPEIRQLVVTPVAEVRPGAILRDLPVDAPSVIRYGLKPSTVDAFKNLAITDSM
jgi:hypothetical protein